MKGRSLNAMTKWLHQPISRRLLLQGLSATGLGISLLPLLQRQKAWALPRDPEERGVEVPPPIFSVAERDRRWVAVRAIMAEPQWNLDAIITTNPGDEAYARYLTQIGGRGGGADVIFPRDPTKKVFALVDGGRPRRFWETRLGDWIADGKLVISSDGGPKDVAKRLKALGLHILGTRIGVAKLVGTRFDPLGLVSSTYLDILKSELPGVSFLPIERWKVDPPDPGPIDEPAMVKSREEQEAVRRSVAGGEKAIETILRVARPPAKQQADLWFPTFTATFLETGEDPDRLSIALDARANTTLGAPTADSLRRGQIISEEIEATVQGYGAQVNHSIFVGNRGTPGFDYYKTAMEVAIELFFDAVKFINDNPGLTTGQLLNHYAAKVTELGAEDSGGVLIHTAGIGNLARPRLGPDDVGSGEDDNIEIVPGMTFDIKPSIRMKREVIEDVGPVNRFVQIGEHILVTASGAVRLGKRELAPIATEG